MERIPLPQTDNELLAQCEVDTFCAGGKGGQHVNRTETAVRVRHLASGLVASCQSERSQLQNKMEAVRNLRRKIERMNYRAPKRVQTKMPRSVRNKILKAKTHQAKKKKLRGKPQMDE